jgi:hypothetical protein
MSFYCRLPFLYFVFFSVSLFLFFWWGGGRGVVTRFDVFVCNQWTASIIAHCDELLLVEIVAYKNTDIQDA